MFQTSLARTRNGKSFGREVWSRDKSPSRVVNSVLAAQGRNFLRRPALPTLKSAFPSQPLVHHTSPCSSFQADKPSRLFAIPSAAPPLILSAFLFRRVISTMNQQPRSQDQAMRLLSVSTEGGVEEIWIRFRDDEFRGSLSCGSM